MYSTNYALLIIPTKKHYTKTETHASHTHHNIPTTRSNHPLDLSISSDNLTHLYFQELLDYGPPIRDSVIHSFLLVLKSSTTNIHFLDTNFHRDLYTHGWNYAYFKYFQHENSSQYAQIT
jgi:hypothetical protein